MMRGMIVRIVSNQYQVYVDGTVHNARPMGKLRLKGKPLVGDHVMLEAHEDGLVIQEVLSRTNQLVRPSVANVDQVLLVMSCKEPDFSFTLVDRLIFMVSYEHIKPVIVLNKADLIEASEIEMIMNEYEPFGYDVIVLGENRDVAPLEAILKDKVSVLSGQSGVGKSSIMNRLNPTFQLNTQEISKSLGRGKHTTRHNELYEIGGGWIADTPGFSSLSFNHMEPLELAHSIIDFKPYLGECKYRDCLHINEPSCKIKEMIDAGKVSKHRHAHYCEIIQEIMEAHS